MKLLPPLPTPRLLPTKPSEPAARPMARTPLELARHAWRPDLGVAPSSRRSTASLADRLRDVPRSRLVIAGLAVAIVGTIVALFLLESQWGYSGRVVPVVFVQSWPADRSAADVAADRAAEIAHARAEFAESRAYIATLAGPARVKAQNQYDAYVAAQPKAVQPEGFVAPKTR